MDTSNELKSEAYSTSDEMRFFPLPTDSEGRTETSDVIVGSVSVIFPLFVICIYMFILQIIWKDKELIALPSYRLMFLLGIFDMLQCIAHIATGIFTLFPPLYDYKYAKIFGAVATPAYITYVIFTFILAFNRMLNLVSRRFDEVFFSGKRLFIWIFFTCLIWISFVGIFASPLTGIAYDPSLYSWSYNVTLKFSNVVQKVEMCIEVTLIVISALFYLIIVIVLATQRKRYSISSKGTERKILIQASFITVYCTILNISWHNLVCLFALRQFYVEYFEKQNLLPVSIWTDMCINMMWIGNTAVNPVMYIIVNGNLRRRIQEGSRIAMSVIPFSKTHKKISVVKTNPYREY